MNNKGMISHLHTGFIFFIFFKEIRVYEQHTEKTDKQTFMILYDNSDKRRGTIYDIFGMLRLNPWIRDRFSGSMFISNIMDNRWTDFHEIFIMCQARHKK